MGAVVIRSDVLSFMVGEIPDIPLLVVEALMYAIDAVDFISAGTLVLKTGVPSGEEESPDISIVVVSITSLVAWGILTPSEVYILLVDSLLVE